MSPPKAVVSVLKTSMSINLDNNGNTDMYNEVIR